MCLTRPKRPIRDALKLSHLMLWHVDLSLDDYRTAPLVFLHSAEAPCVHILLSKIVDFENSSLIIVILPQWGQNFVRRSRTLKRMTPRWPGFTTKESQQWIYLYRREQCEQCELRAALGVLYTRIRFKATDLSRTPVSTTRCQLSG